MKNISVLYLAGLLVAGAPANAESQSTSERQEAAHSSDTGLILKTSDGRQWTGATPRIQIFGPVAGQPEMARISLAVTSGEGERLGVYAELNTSALFQSQWEAQLDGQNATRPGFGVLSLGTRNKPEIADSGKLTISARGARLTGKLQTSVDALNAATFEGSFVVECLVADHALQRPVNGSLSSGAALGLDVNFESGFCQPFQKLQNLAGNRRK